MLFCKGQPQAREPVVEKKYKQNLYFNYLTLAYLYNMTLVSTKIWDLTA